MRRGVGRGRTSVLVCALLVLAGVLAGVLVGCDDRAAAPPAAQHPGRVTSGRCHGVPFDGVQGTPPRYGERVLTRYPADGAVCAAYWIPQASRRFVPQSLAVDGHLAYVTGYRWSPTLSKRPCQIVVIDTRSGREVAFQPRFEASLYHPRPTYCRHGGGTELTGAGLWVQETQRLWLLDPARIGSGDPVVRAWRMGGWTKGSAMVVRGARLGVASYRPHRPGRIHWFRVADLLAPGVDDLVPSGGNATDARPVAAGRVPAGLQGITSRHGRLWFSVSNTRCGALVAPGGRRSGFVPGGEDVQFVGRDLWTVSEAGASPYVSRGEGLVPMLLRFDGRAVTTAPATCRP